MNEKTLQATRLWTLAMPGVSAFITSIVRNFEDRNDILQDTAVAVVESFEKYDPEWFAFYNKKFAELIIRECSSEIRKQGNGASYDDWDRGYEAGLISAINTLHKHFGVE